jgi:hypothetical protein
MLNLIKSSILILLFPIFSYAYEPQFSIADNDIDQNFRNVALEIRDLSSLNGDGVFTGSNTFSNTTATTTFSGWVDIGLITISSGMISLDKSTATCTAGYAVIGGGCGTTNDASSMTDSRPTTAGTGWYCNWASVGDIVTAYAICARIKP